MTDEQAQAEHERKRRNYMIAMAVVSMVSAFALIQWVPETQDWSVGRKIAGSLLMGVWCTYMLTLTRLGGAFK